MKSSAVVIPTLNEESSVGNLLGVLMQNPRITRIIVVDDNSTDKTREQVLHYATKDSRIKLVERSGSRSFSGSYRDGFLAAIANGSDYIIQMDADGSHPASALDDMLDALETHDIVIGSRFISGSKTTGRNATRRAVSRLGNNFARFALKTDISDMTGGFNGWRTDVLRELLDVEFPYRGFAIQIWLKHQATQRHIWKEIPIHFIERKHGKSKFTLDIFREGMMGIMEMRFNRSESKNLQSSLRHDQKRR